VEGRFRSRGQPPSSLDAEAGFELVHADTLRLFPELVAELGGDPDAYMRVAGLDRSILARNAARVSYRSMIELLEQSAVRLQRPDFGMRLAARQGGGSVFGPIGVVMRNSGTFGDALAYVADHIHAYSLAASLRIEQDRMTGRVLVGFDILLENLPNKSQTIEQLLLLAHLNALEITEGRARVREVRFRHQPVSPLRVYRDYFGCDVRFGQSTEGMIFDQKDLDAPVVQPDLQLHEMATFFIDANFPAAVAPMHARVRGLVMKHLGVSDCKIDRIADELCLHPRTLHRRLKYENKSFEDIKNEVRRDMARYYIEQTDIAFSRISEKLGYSETSVLSRTCLRWFGACPREMRARVLGEQPHELELVD
jgi:AraC-like DNA-binding protein